LDDGEGFVCSLVEGKTLERLRQARLAMPSQFHTSNSEHATVFCPFLPA
jgi:hypothetical protein